MELYGLKQRKRKKWWLVPIIVVAVLLLVIYAVGIIINITNADHDKISRSVAENTRLKAQVNELNIKISELEEQISSLNAQLSEREQVGDELESPMPSHTPNQNQSTPRNNNY